MTIEIKVPPLPESVTDATLVAWHKTVGERVARDENLVDLETDKVVLEVPAPAAGRLRKSLSKMARRSSPATCLPFLRKVRLRSSGTGSRAGSCADVEKTAEKQAAPAGKNNEGPGQDQPGSTTPAGGT